MTEKKTVDNRKLTSRNNWQSKFDQQVDVDNLSSTAKLIEIQILTETTIENWNLTQIMIITNRKLMNKRS